MKLTTAQIAGFLQKPPRDIRAILFYGPDAGLVRERAQNMAALIVPDQSDPFAITQIAGAALGSDAARLYDEAAALSFGGGRRLVRLQQATENNAAALAPFLAEPPPGNSMIVIEAGDLDKRSKLRAVCEGETPFAAAVPCYIEDAAARQRTIVEHLEKEGLKVSRDVARFLADCLPPDRLAMRSELNKLALYARGAGSISLEDVQAVIANASAAEVDDLVQAAASGDVKKSSLLLDHLIAEQTSPVALLRAMQRHLMRLQIARFHLEQGASAAESIKKLSPPVFWKFVDPMTRQVNRWGAGRIELRLQQLAEAEVAVKRTGTPDTTLCAQLFISIAAKA